ncbi:hypothetical protein EDC91_1212 [Shewanella fodinae]|uniref:Uncharacterized protein n=1 Tax=Shewanella fodinae TaxID=552357 RepID=A0A4R2F7Y4_9GAMM|nr:hypothetical protein EDC91_1212 [Shewanella fodinae]
MFSKHIRLFVAHAGDNICDIIRLQSSLCNQTIPFDSMFPQSSVNWERLYWEKSDSPDDMPVTMPNRFFIQEILNVRLS